MTPEELIEKMARELCRQSNGMEIMWKQWRDEAMALHAIVREAMREPSDAMERAAAMDIYRHQDGLAWEDAATCYRAMLAASPLREPKP